MNSFFPLLVAGMVGFSHAFEIDHLVAVSSLVTRRQNLVASLKDGIYWGMGHTSTILGVGILMILLKIAIAEATFSYLEAGVGIMLIVLGGHRLWKSRTQSFMHQHDGHAPHSHKLAYSVGLVHGLAGSGTLVLLVMSQMRSNWEGIVYLLIFGIGSIGGMLLASGMFSLPFSKKWGAANRIQRLLTLLSSLLCMGLGAKILCENLMG